MKLWRHTITWMDRKGIIDNNCQIIDNNLSNYCQIDKKSTSKSQMLYDSLCINPQNNKTVEIQIGGCQGLRIGSGKNVKGWRVGITTGMSMKDPCGNGTVLHLEYEW